MLNIDENEQSVSTFKNELDILREKVKSDEITYEDLEYFYEKYKLFFLENGFRLSCTPVLHEILGCGFLLLNRKKE